MINENSIVLSVKDIKKKINKKWIIKGVTFDVHEGEVFGFLGPNGAGKTTTIRMLVDLIKPTKGAVFVCGVDVHKQHNEALQHVGCIVENPEMYEYLSGWENLEQFSRMLPDVTLDRIHEVVSIVGLEQRINDRVKTYSLGMKQRLGIAQALLGNPKLLILDEPTNGLDPQGIKEMRLFIRKLAADGLSVFVSSHLLSEIQLMCDRVAIISHGKVLAVGEVETLLKEVGSKVEWHIAPLERARKVMEHTKNIHVLSEQVRIDQEDKQEKIGIYQVQMNVKDVPQFSETFVLQGLRLYAVELKKPSLEDLFLSVTEGEEID